MSKNSSLKKTGPSSDQKLVCSDNHWENIWNKIKKSSKSGQNKASLISTFVCFLTASAKV